MSSQDEMTVKTTKIMQTEIPNTEITEAVYVEAHTGTEGLGPLLGEIPAYVRVTIHSHPEEGSNIVTKVFLPVDNWNGRLYALGNGGYAGTVSDDPYPPTMKMGFAMASTDLGTSAGPDCGIGNKAVWKDFGHRANHEMAVCAKSIIEAFYGRQPDYSYFIGGSTGGQQALAIAQRYPEDFDGILAATPAYDRVNLHIGFLWDYLCWLRSKEAPFTQEEAEAIVRAFLEKKAEEGEKGPEDDFFCRPDRIQPEASVFDGLGFSEEKINALLGIYGGAIDPVTGKRIYEGTMVPGSETQGLGLISRSANTFCYEFLYLFRWVLGADFDFTSFDFHKDTEYLRSELQSYLDATDPDLSAFRSRGGKLLLVHGTSDPIIPMGSSIRYYEDVQRKMGNTDDFFRLFLIPGMAHVVGGPGFADYGTGLPATPKDRYHFGLVTLQAWVEEGKAPDYILPVKFKKEPFAFAKPDGMLCDRKVYPYKMEK